ncbi:hypothetical protein AURDEDRAFT_175635 [Auricularia subglabra TFB-10046 SS5]|uniref:Protein kinase domain-containing protein n=1 Tax=Auricularia subglabra (strain TFB-10046 / SS5) TaxID=717982 RepID=J0LEN1_AURST|nr:hypothetical protein AURDEDRAFT_175635 [Auricularia subglabra TFB-10046 SS5]
MPTSAMNELESTDSPEKTCAQGVQERLGAQCSGGQDKELLSAIPRDLAATQPAAWYEYQLGSEKIAMEHERNAQNSRAVTALSLERRGGPTTRAGSTDGAQYKLVHLARANVLFLAQSSNPLLTTHRNTKMARTSSQRGATAESSQANCRSGKDPTHLALCASSTSAHDPQMDLQSLARSNHPPTATHSRAALGPACKDSWVENATGTATTRTTGEEPGPSSARTSGTFSTRTSSSNGSITEGWKGSSTISPSRTSPQRPSPSRAWTKNERTPTCVSSGVTGSANVVDESGRSSCNVGATGSSISSATSSSGTGSDCRANARSRGWLRTGTRCGSPTSRTSGSSGPGSPSVASSGPFDTGSNGSCSTGSNESPYIGPSASSTTGASAPSSTGKSATSGTSTPSAYGQFVDTAGRTVMFRGVNLSRSSKAPVGQQSQVLDGFWEDGHDGGRSFTGQPLNLDDGSADVHLARLRGWGFNVLRFPVTWEALENEARKKHDYEHMDSVVKVLRKCKEHGFKVVMDPHQDVLGVAKSDSDIIETMPDGGAVYLTIIGEIAIPYDMEGCWSYGHTDNGKALGNYSQQEEALDTSLNACDGPNALSYAIWTYVPDCSHEWGDGWNGEVFSLWCEDDKRPLPGSAWQMRQSRLSLLKDMFPPSLGISKDTEPAEKGSWENTYDFLPDRARARRAFVRPHHAAIVGVPVRWDLKIAKATFVCTVRVSSDDAPRARRGDEERLASWAVRDNGANIARTSSATSRRGVRPAACHLPGGERMKHGKLQHVGCAVEKCRGSDVDAGVTWRRMDYRMSGVSPEQAFKGRYVPVSSLGDGGYGEVFKAVSVKDQKTYAVKTTRIPTDEWTILRRLAHSAIVECYESFESEGFTCIVMECADGGALAKYGILDETTAKCVGRDVAAGLAHMHAQGIAHRDIKPENVVFTNEAHRSVKIVDFGIAVTVDEDGFIKGKRGTKDFRAPEVEQSGAYTVRADLWSLGVTVLYW